MNFMRFSKKYLVVTSVLLIMCLFAGCGPKSTTTEKSETPESSDNVITLKAGHVLASDHPYHLGLVKIG